MPETRNDPSDWKSGKYVEEIAKIKAVGSFIDLIQWRAHRSHAVGMADDGYVLEFRNSDAGKDMFYGDADDFSDDVIAQHERRPEVHRLWVEVAPDHDIDVHQARGEHADPHLAPAAVGSGASTTSSPSGPPKRLT